jgi:hypothetical protein
MFHLHYTARISSREVDYTLTRYSQMLLRFFYPQGSSKCVEKKKRKEENQRLEKPTQTRGVYW